MIAKSDQFVYTLQIVTLKFFLTKVSSHCDITRFFHSFVLDRRASNSLKKGWYSNVIEFELRHIPSLFCCGYNTDLTCSWMKKLTNADNPCCFSMWSLIWMVGRKLQDCWRMPILGHSQPKCSCVLSVDVFSVYLQPSGWHLKGFRLPIWGLICLYGGQQWVQPTHKFPPLTHVICLLALLGRQCSFWVDISVGATFDANSAVSMLKLTVTWWGQ